MKKLQTILEIVFDWSNAEFFLDAGRNCNLTATFKSSNFSIGQSSKDKFLTVL